MVILAMLEDNLQKCCLQSKPGSAVLAVVPMPGAKGWQRGRKVDAVPMTTFCPSASQKQKHSLLV